MKILLSIITLLTVISSLLRSQGCLPEGIIFTSQEQIDNFQANFPGCNFIEGSVTIEGDEIFNLSGLDVLTGIGADLQIINNVGLINLIGISNLQSIGGNLTIGGNTVLTDLSGLESLTNIANNLWIYENNNLINLSGFEALVSIGANLSLYYNPSLSDLTEISTLSHIGDAIYIDNNDSLTSLIGLNNINPNSILNLVITSNQMLTTCDVESICGYLADPSGIVQIFDNAIGCNSQQEIQEACDEITVEEHNSVNQISIFPNPAFDQLTIRSNPSKKIKSVRIYNQIGESVFLIYPLNNTINISSIQQGIYVIEVKYTDSIIRQKLIIR